MADVTGPVHMTDFMFSFATRSINHFNNEPFTAFCADFVVVLSVGIDFANAVQIAGTATPDGPFSEAKSTRKATPPYLTIVATRLHVSKHIR